MNTRSGTKLRHAPTADPDGHNWKGICADIKRLRADPKHNVKGGWRGQKFNLKKS